MGRGIYFNGTSSQGVLDSTINLADGESFECDFLSQDGSASGTVAIDQALCSSADGSDMIVPQYANGSNLVQFGVYVDSVLYSSGTVSDFIFDGNLHRIIVTRNGADFEFNVDGLDVATSTATTGTFSVDYIAKDMANTAYIDAFLGDIVIGSNTYPANAGTGNTLADTSGAGNDITLTDPTWAAISTWEWIGDFTHIDKTYNTPNGVVTERRREGTRRRCVTGFAMNSPATEQVGEVITEASGDEVYALNGGQESGLGSVLGSGGIICEHELFTPMTGTNIFIQSQKWVSLYQVVA